MKWVAVIALLAGCTTPASEHSGEWAFSVTNTHSDRANVTVLNAEKTGPDMDRWCRFALEPNETDSCAIPKRQAREDIVVFGQWYNATGELSASLTGRFPLGQDVMRFNAHPAAIEWLPS